MADLATIDSLTHLLSANVNIQVASEQDIENALSKYYREKKGAVVDAQFEATV